MMKDLAKEAGWVILMTIFASIGGVVFLIGGALTLTGMFLMWVVAATYDKLKDLSPFKDKDQEQEEKKEDPD